jgi:hypothetical protein
MLKIGFACGSQDEELLEFSPSVPSLCLSVVGWRRSEYFDELHPLLKPSTLSGYTAPLI